MKTNDEVEFTIDRLSSGGRGVGRSDGIVIFVPNTAPQEKIRARITLIKKNFAEAELVEVLEPSPFRIEAPCPVAGLCGGCTWQHVEYQEQLRQKQTIVADALRKFAKRGLIEVLPTLPSPQPFAYRNRVQLHYRDGKIGFFRKGTNQIAPIETCLITDSRLNEKISALRDSLKKENSPPTRKELYLTEKNDVAVSSQNRFDDELGFAQVNEAQNQVLLSYVSARVGSPKLLLDLYAGAGNFALRLARDHQEILKAVAVELHPKSVEHGRERALKLGLKGIEFVHSGVGAFLTEVLRARTKSVKSSEVRDATVVLDPPRAGCEKGVMESLLTLTPKTLLYVSCDPVTLARDLAELPSERYEIVSVQPLDMFPQTDHVETIVHLERSGKKP